MASLVECVPNFSEGSEVGVIEAIESGIESRDDVWLLDRTSDVDHDRSVFTLVGGPSAVASVVETTVGVAVEHIDMRLQHGQHPRIGAADVVPFVPLGTSTMEECVELARGVGATIADRFELPVYLYAESATRPARRILAAIRRPGFEGLSEWMALPGNEPDFGPREPHPSAGATVVGARPLLIAFNVQLSTLDVSVARSIAAGLRERSGGLPAVQAIGIHLVSEGRAQVSMNLLDHLRTPLWRVWSEVHRLSRAAGVTVLDSELIGLVPAAALIEVADHLGVPASHPLESRLVQAASWLRIRDFRPDMALELRLLQKRVAAPA